MKIQDHQLIMTETVADCAIQMYGTWFSKEIKMFQASQVLRKMGFEVDSGYVKHEYIEYIAPDHIVNRPDKDEDVFWSTFIADYMSDNERKNFCIESVKMWAIKELRQDIERDTVIKLVSIINEMPQLGFSKNDLKNLFTNAIARTQQKETA